MVGWTPDPGSRSQGGKPRMGTERPERGTESKGFRQATGQAWEGQAGERHAGPRGLRDGPSFQSVSPAPPKVQGSGLWSSHGPVIWSE